MCLRFDQTRRHLRWPLMSVYGGGCDHLHNALQSKSAPRASHQFQTVTRLLRSTRQFVTRHKAVCYGTRNKADCYAEQGRSGASLTSTSGLPRKLGSVRALSASLCFHMMCIPSVTRCAVLSFSNIDLLDVEHSAVRSYAYSSQQHAFSAFR